MTMTMTMSTTMARVDATLQQDEAAQAEVARCGCRLSLSAALVTGPAPKETHLREGLVPFPLLEWHCWSRLVGYFANRGEGVEDPMATTGMPVP